MASDVAGLVRLFVLGPYSSALWAPAMTRFSLSTALRKANSNQGQSGSTKQALKKPKLPLGRFDAPEDSNLEQEPLEKFPDDVNPLTKEKGGPKGPEPTRYGDWERKGRCVDF
ncbi:succinate dehydrogenase assembly factor 4, mitochondrial isoform X1 [Monodelphis domestica]|uniref:succinate dehydrogenase assembly factor 4, mitochondrial isoform X1 n=1 Tax=Monodelphis domestica TaxID=13616 RepID=UPI0024E24C68|nr:succinate dehydrogenase assembly factor 4, mitochondrial isoform X1 [Monodelphis domestica]